MPTVADVRTRLHSTDGSEVAWAAFDAATFHMPEVVPDLIAVLEARSYIDPGARNYLVAALLDALIQAQIPRGVPIQGTLDPTTFAQFVEDWPVQTLILFGRIGPERDGILLDLLPRSSGKVWWGVANLLVYRRVPGFAAEVLHGVELNLEIRVTDPGIGSGGGIGGGMYADCCPMGDQLRPRSYPPEAVYDFTENVPGAIVLSRGPRPVYYTRRLTTDPIGRVRRSRIDPGPDVDTRLDYINALLGGFAEPDLRSHMRANIEWQDEQTFLTRVEMERSLVERRYQQMLERLISYGGMSRQEAHDLPLRLNVQVSDDRTSPTSPLPIIPPAH